MPVPASHTRAVVSPLAVTMRAPSGLKATWRTEALCPSSSSAAVAVLTSHTFAVPSKEAVATRVLSGLNHAWVTVSLCPKGGARPTRARWCLRWR